MARETIFTNPPQDGPAVVVPTVVWDRDGQSVALTVRHAIQEHDEAALWADLDRGQINRLIAVLRRARDAAYGADA